MADLLELSEVADGIAVVESFSHRVALRTDGGLIIVDASGAPTGGAVAAAIGAWSTDRIDTLAPPRISRHRRQVTLRSLDSPGPRGGERAPGRPPVVPTAPAPARQEPDPAEPPG